MSIGCDKSVDISVADNGTGIDENNINKGNGLRNMKARAKESGLDIKITNENTGTRLWLFN